MALETGQLRAAAEAAARHVGFDLCGIVDLHGRSIPELSFFSEWIERGHAGEMTYLEARNDAGKFKRASPEATFPWVRSLIVLALNYNSAAPRSVEVAHNKARGWISRYAWSREDYHDVLLRKLRQVDAALHEFHSSSEGNHQALQTRCYVDTGPFVERVYAKYAGLGWIGKNTCLISQQVGSWLFLGVIATSWEFANTPNAIPLPDRCGSCTRCLDACPTQAFIAPYQMDATRCISYLTIEKRGSVPPQLRPQMGNHLFGCDICQDVCPWNRKAPVSTVEEFEPRTGLVNPPLENFAEMTREQFQQTFRRSPVKRAKYSGLRRNAAVAMGNSGDPSFIPQLKRMADDEDPGVAEHARWALERISNPR
jgi:epoxyqueuosine reductase